MKQEKAGSRWLVANGMGKKNGKHPLMKSKAGGGADKASGFRARVGIWFPELPPPTPAPTVNYV